MILTWEQTMARIVAEFVVELNRLTALIERYGA